MQMNDISIEPAKSQEEYDTCANMMASTDPWARMGIDYDTCRHVFEGQCRECFILRSKGTIAGFVILQTCGSFRGYIQTICIEEAWRGMGLGTTLLKFCENRILEYSPNIFICVSAFNERALKLYLDFGFKPVGELRDFIKEGFTELLLRKTVGPVAGYSTH